MASCATDRRPAPGTGSQHWVTNLVFEGNHSRVRLKSFFIRHNIDNGVVTSTNLGYYRDDVVNADGRWLFNAAAGACGRRTTTEPIVMVGRVDRYAGGVLTPCAIRSPSSRDSIATLRQDVLPRDGLFHS